MKIIAHPCSKLNNTADTRGPPLKITLELGPYCCFSQALARFQQVTKQQRNKTISLMKQAHCDHDIPVPKMQGIPEN
jgi:hypothetical protein